MEKKEPKKEKIIQLTYNDEKKEMAFIPDNYSDLKDYFLSVFEQKSSKKINFFFTKQNINVLIEDKQDLFQKTINEIAQQEEPIIYASEDDSGFLSNDPFGGKTMQSGLSENATLKEQNVPKYTIPKNESVYNNVSKNLFEDSILNENKNSEEPKLPNKKLEDELQPVKTSNKNIQELNDKMNEIIEKNNQIFTFLEKIEKEQIINQNYKLQDTNNELKKQLDEMSKNYDEAKQELTNAKNDNEELKKRIEQLENEKKEMQKLMEEKEKFYKEKEEEKNNIFNILKEMNKKVEHCRNMEEKINIFD